jgi:hypothetical protein
MNNKSNVCELEIAKGVINVLKTMIQHGIFPLFVVSGSISIPEKALCTQKRTNCRQNMLVKAKRIQDEIYSLQQNITNNKNDVFDHINIAELTKQCTSLQSNARYISRDCAHKVLTIVESSLSSKYCQKAKCEADFLLMLLSETNECDLVATDDADIVVAGARKTLRGLISLLHGGTGFVYSRVNIMKHFKLTSNQLIELGTLLSCDYQPSLCSVGPITALRALQQHKTVSNFMYSDDFDVCTKRSKKRKFLTPNNMNKDDYIKMTNNTVKIFKHRPDQTKKQKKC